MTFAELEKRIEKYNIPKDVELRSDSGWECSDTAMDGLYYNKEENKLYFLQEFENPEFAQWNWYECNCIRLE